MSLKSALTLSLTGLLFTACQANTSLNAVSTTPALTATASTALESTTELAPIALSPLSLEQISAAAIQTPDFQSNTTEIDFSASEMSSVKALIQQAEQHIAAEDLQHQQQAVTDFQIKTAQQGKDVDVQLFLYDAKYGKQAKKWNIDTAHDFLQAGRSPWRRWTLRLKLEGLFAPSGFSQQVLFWVEQADLLRVSGVDRDQAWLLAASGITSIPDLARRTNVIEQSTLQVSMKIMALSYGLSAPSLNELKNWVTEAQGLEPVIY